MTEWIRYMYTLYHQTLGAFYDLPSNIFCTSSDIPTESSACVTSFTVDESVTESSMIQIFPNINEYSHRKAKFNMRISLFLNFPRKWKCISCFVYVMYPSRYIYTLQWLIRYGRYKFVRMRQRHMEGQGSGMDTWGWVGVKYRILV